MKKRLLMVLVIGAATLAVFVAIGGYLISQRLVPRQFQVFVPNITFSLKGEKTPVESGKNLDVAVLIDTRETILATDLDIRYDPKVVIFTKVTPGDLFSSPIEFSKSVNAKEGKIFYALGSLSQAKRNGTVAVFSFRGIINSSYAGITLGDKTLASVKGDRKVKIVLPTY